MLSGRIEMFFFSPLLWEAGYGIIHVDTVGSVWIVPRANSYKPSDALSPHSSYYSGAMHMSGELLWHACLSKWFSLLCFSMLMDVREISSVKLFVLRYGMMHDMFTRRQGSYSRLVCHVSHSRLLWFNCRWASLHSAAVILTLLPIPHKRFYDAAPSIDLHLHTVFSVGYTMT